MTQINFNEVTGLKIKQGQTITDEKYLIIKQGNTSKLVWANPSIYLQTDGNAYIDTGFIANDETGYEVLCTIPPDNGTDNLVLGSRTNSTHTRFWYDLDWTNDYVSFGWNAYESTRWFFSSFGLAEGDNVLSRCNYLNDRKIIINQTQKASTLPTLSAQNGNVWIFKANYTSLDRPYYGKLKNVKFTQGNSIIRNFVPVPQGMVIGNTTITENCLFDIVTQTPYYNAGGGSFTYGQEQPTRGGGGLMLKKEIELDAEEIKVDMRTQQFTSAPSGVTIGQDS